MRFLAVGASGPFSFSWEMSDKARLSPKSRAGGGGGKVGRQAYASCLLKLGLGFGVWGTRMLGLMV